MLDHSGYRKDNMVRLASIMQGAATGKAVLSIGIPAIVIYLIMLFYTIPVVEQHAAGMKLFDLSPTGYSYEYASDLLTALGDNGRAAYLNRQLPLDFIYPGLFAVSCCLLLVWLLKKCLKNSPWLYLSSIVPLAAGLFDYAENLLIVQMLTSYPSINLQLVRCASTMTILKSLFTTVFFLFLLIVIVWCIISRKKGTEVESV